MNSFLASGGYNFPAIRAGTDAVNGPLDLDAQEAYIAAHTPLSPPALGRVENRTKR